MCCMPQLAKPLALNEAYVKLTRRARRCCRRPKTVARCKPHVSQLKVAQAIQNIVPLKKSIKECALWQMQLANQAATHHRY